MGREIWHGWQWQLILPPLHCHQIPKTCAARSGPRHVPSPYVAGLEPGCLPSLYFLPHPAPCGWIRPCCACPMHQIRPTGQIQPMEGLGRVHPAHGARKLGTTDLCKLKSLGTLARARIWRVGNVQTQNEDSRLAVIAFRKSDGEGKLRPRKCSTGRMGITIHLGAGYGRRGGVGVAMGQIKI